MEVKMCEPINMDRIEDKNIYDLVKEWKELEDFVIRCEGGDSRVRLSFTDNDEYEIETSLANTHDIIGVLLRRMEDIEVQLNYYGYTMHESPRDFRYHKE